MHTRSKHWHLIDYVIVRRTDRQCFIVTKTLCGADCWTDHRLVVSKLNLRIQPARPPQGKTAPKRLDVSKLNQDSMRQAFIDDICNHLGGINLSSEDPEKNMTVFPNVVHSSATTTLGHPPGNTETGLMRMMKKLSPFLKNNTACTRHIEICIQKGCLQTHARFLVEQESRRNPVFCRQKGHEEVP